jgi:hypothetical protein
MPNTRNSSAIFYVENSNPEELAKNIQKLVELIKAENFEVLRVFSEWFEQFHDTGEETKTTSKIRKLTEVTSMYATALENYGKKNSVQRDITKTEYSN